MSEKPKGLPRIPMHFPPTVNNHGAFLHAMTDEDRAIISGLTSAINRLASAIESQNDAGRK